MPSTPFFATQHDFALSQGSMKLPCHFRKVHFSVAMFAVGKDRARPFLENKGLKPALPWFGNKVMVALGLISYTDSDLGAYEEVIVALPSVRDGEGAGAMNWAGLLRSSETMKVGMHIIHIPVTSERSRIAGQECWGYPKRVLPIKHELGDVWIASVVKDERGMTILSCSGKKGMGIPIPSLQLMTYSFVQDKFTRTPVRIRGGMHWHPFADVRITLGDSKDPMAEDLRSLGLDGAKAAMFLDAPEFQAVFGAGVPQ